MPDLSVLIPARKEEWLSRTVEDVLAHSSDRTEVIVVLDEDWPNPPLTQHPRVQVLREPRAVGQRAATNLAASLSTARYIMKLDAHCSMAPGFDVALLDAAEKLEREVVQIPAQKNLHVFDMVCEDCGYRRDQSPVRAQCPKCQSVKARREVIWQPRPSPTSSAWRFDADLHFQYWSGARKAQKGNPLPEVMSCLGACWFLNRGWFWELGGLDESHGSWGQMGTELACKAWLSGGRMVCNKATWFSHFFRVGGHKFPYEIHGSDQDYARTYSQNLWRGNRWAKQIHPLRWLVEKFSPPGWTKEQIDALPKVLHRVDAASVHRAPGVLPLHASGPGERLAVEAIPADRLVANLDRGVPAPERADYRAGKGSKGICYYSDCRGAEAILSTVRAQVKRSGNGHAIVSVTLQPLDFGRNIILPLERGYLSMFRQILAGLEALDTEFAFLVEHDVLYAPDHFQFTPPNDSTYYYNTNVWHVEAKTGQAITYTAKRTSQLCANRLLLVEHYQKRVAIVERDGFSIKMGFEPGSHGRKERVDDIPSATWHSARPNIDIKHGQNLTPARWAPEQFRDQRNCQGWQESGEIPGWGRTLGRFTDFLREVRKGQHASPATIAVQGAISVDDVQAALP